jgi:hypothetical protein
MGKARRKKRRRGGHPRRAVTSSMLQPGRPQKLSDALIQLIAPFRQDGLTLRSYEALIGAAASAWNLTLLNEGAREEALRKAIGKVPAVEAAMLAQLLAELIRRKQELFPKDRRMVVHWAATELADEYRVTVASAA